MSPVLDMKMVCIPCVYGHESSSLTAHNSDYHGGRTRSPGYRSSRFPDPYDSDCPVPMRSFIDWFQFARPEEFADDERATQEAMKNGQSALTVGVKARYEKYRKHMITKQVRSLTIKEIPFPKRHLFQMDIMFRYHIKFPWFNEKYNPALPFVNLRRRVRREGWDGLINKFIQELRDGRYDPATELEATFMKDSKPVPYHGAMFTRSEDEVLIGNGDEKDEHGNDRDDAEFTSSVQNGENGDDATVDPITTVGDVPNTETSEKPDLRNKTQPSTKDHQKEDEVMVEPDGNQVLIRTIPPDIGRVKLEKVMSPREHRVMSIDSVLVDLSWNPRFRPSRAG
jgi:hypothetical protein